MPLYSAGSLVIPGFGWKANSGSSNLYAVEYNNSGSVFPSAGKFFQSVLGTNWSLGDPSLWTVECRFKCRTATAQSQTIFTLADNGTDSVGGMAGNGISLLLTTAGHLIVVSRDNLGVWTRVVEGTANVMDGLMHHVAVKHTGTLTGTLYVDGVPNVSWTNKYCHNYSGQVASVRFGSSTVGSVYTAADFTLGPRFYFDGTIDDIRFWSALRSDAEILANYTGELVGNETNLRNYWKFSEGTGTSIAGLGAIPASGTLYGTPTWVTGI